MRARSLTWLIGGMSNAAWGEPRATLDIDLTIWIDENNIPPLLTRLEKEFDLLPDRPLAFMLETHVLPVKTRSGVRIDLIWGNLPYEEEAIKRAIPMPVSGQSVRFCTAEDMILHKIISSREKNLSDVKWIAVRQAKNWT